MSFASVEVSCPLGVVSILFECPWEFVDFSQHSLCSLHRQHFYSTGKGGNTLAPCRFCNTLLHFRPLQVWLGAFLQHPTALLRLPNRVAVGFAILYVTFASSLIASEADLQYLTVFWGRPRAILQYLTAFLAPSKFCNTLLHSGTLGREFAIPY